MVPSKYLDSFTAFSLSISQIRNNGQVDFTLVVPIQSSDYYNGINLIDACIHDTYDLQSMITDSIDVHRLRRDNPIDIVL